MNIGHWQKRYNALSDDQFWEIAYGENCLEQINKLEMFVKCIFLEEENN